MRFTNNAIAVALLTLGVNGVAPAEETAALPKPTSKWNKEICKTETVVGRLIPGPRRCHTAAQWEEHARASQAIGHRLVDDNRGMNGAGPN